MSEKKRTLTKKEIEQIDKNAERFCDTTGWTFQTEEEQAASKLYNLDLTKK